MTTTRHDAARLYERLWGAEIDRRKGAEARAEFAERECAALRASLLLALGRERELARRLEARGADTRTTSGPRE